MKTLIILTLLFSSLANAGLGDRLSKFGKKNTLSKYVAKNASDFELDIEENFNLRVAIYNKSIKCVQGKLSKVKDLVGTCLLTASNAKKDYMFSASFDEDGNPIFLLLDQYERPRI